MKTFLFAILLGVALFATGLGFPALADMTQAADIPQTADIQSGAKIFQGNCSACHIGGGNVVIVNKTLKKEALIKYDKYSLAAIQTQVTKGRNAMPAFGSRLTKQQIENVAAYVLQQADNGWK